MSKIDGGFASWGIGQVYPPRCTRVVRYGSCWGMCAGALGLPPLRQLVASMVMHVSGLENQREVQKWVIYV